MAKKVTGWGVYLSDLAVEVDRLVRSYSTREAAVKTCRLLNAEVIGQQVTEWAKLPRRVMPLYYVDRLHQSTDRVEKECTEDS